ncbi:MAG: ABC transporter permease [Gemmatimonadetes bacterium]|nr:ABC transporter permease [Gemmatimonadota bacterium]
MPIGDAFLLALRAIWAHKLRSFFTLLGIIVSVAFLVAVLAIIHGMNAYVRENIVQAIAGSNTFQVRRDPLLSGFNFDELEWRRIERRPVVSRDDAEAVARAIPDARAVAIQTGFPPPFSEVRWHGQSADGVITLGITPAWHRIQEHQFAMGHGLSDVDVSQRRPVAVIGWDVYTQLMGEQVPPVGQRVRVNGHEVTVVGVVGHRGTVLGQSRDNMILLPFPTFEGFFGRRKTTVVFVKMAEVGELSGAMARAEQAMRVRHRLRPMQENDFTIEASDALVGFWTRLTSLLFAIIPSVVVIGVLVGGIVIMNIMLMTVNERTHEIGIRKSLGARARDIRRQFLIESATMALMGGAMGVLAGTLFASLIATVTPLPARVSLTSVLGALALGAAVGIVFGVVPAARAARLDPVVALRAET